MLSRSTFTYKLAVFGVICIGSRWSFGAFVPRSRSRFSTYHAKHQPVLLSTVFEENDLQAKSFCLSRDEIKPIFQIGKGEKEKLVNAFGLWCMVVSLITSPIWAAAMSFLNLMYKVNDDWDPHRAAYDTTGKIWSKSWLKLCDSMPTSSGHVEQLKEGNGPCLFVANHASWLDIPILCTVLDPVFKFIAKGELRGVPCIGQQLVGGHHILIDREDRRSQLRTFKDGISWLKKGVPLMAFPEGRRSKDGRLMEFKGGLFSMAAKTKVPIVPITISHAHAVMPCNSLFPVQRGSGKLHIHVHEPIHASGRSEEELVRLVKQAFLSTLPFEQQPTPEEQHAGIGIETISEVSSRVTLHEVANNVPNQHHDSNMNPFIDLNVTNGASLHPCNQRTVEELHETSVNDDASEAVKITTQ